MRFYIKQKVFSIKDKFKVFNDMEEVVYEVNGSFFSIFNKLELVDVSGLALYTSKKKLFRLFSTYDIFDEFNSEVATIKRKFSLTPKFELLIMNKFYTVEGSLFAHSFNILRKGEVVASISKKVISWGDTYEIEIYEEDNIELFLFVVIILDQVIHERKNRN